MNNNNWTEIKKSLSQYIYYTQKLKNQYWVSEISSQPSKSINSAAMLKIQMLEQIVTRDSVAEEQQDGGQQVNDGWVPCLLSISVNY